MKGLYHITTIDAQDEFDFWLTDEEYTQIREWLNYGIAVFIPFGPENGDELGRRYSVRASTIRCIHLHHSKDGTLSEK